MNLSHLAKICEKFVKDNSPTILTVIGVSGVAVTSYLTGRAAYRSVFKLQEEAKTRQESLTRRDVIKLIWKDYIPSAVCGVITASCIVGSTRIGVRRTTALAAAYTISEQAYAEYRDRVAETFGKGKERALRDQLAQDKVLDNPPKSVIITGGGDILSYEAFTGRYFKSDMETLRRAVNVVNDKLLKHDFAYLNDFYDLVGLPYTSVSDRLGWESGRLMELEFSTVFSPEEKPCICFAYNYTRPI